LEPLYIGRCSAGGRCNGSCRCHKSKLVGVHPRWPKSPTRTRLNRSHPMSGPFELSELWPTGGLAKPSASDHDLLGIASTAPLRVRGRDDGLALDAALVVAAADAEVALLGPYGFQELAIFQYFTPFSTPQPTTFTAWPPAMSPVTWW